MDKNKKDFLITTLGFQFLICAILFGICFGIKVTQKDFLISLKNEYFDKLESNIIINKINKINEKNETKDTTVSVNTDETIPLTTETVIIDKTEPTIPTTDEKLTAEIKAEGGNDFSINSKNEIPKNVSVNGYTLSQKMVLPVEGEITSEFGVRTHPIDGELRFHAGIDIAAPMGTAIFSAYDGTVIEAKYDQWNGNYLKIQHDNGITTVYCHCEKLNVSKGEVVRAGEIVATVGSTGSSTGPHLHFELRIDGISYNPKNALENAVSAV